MDNRSQLTLDITKENISFMTRGMRSNTVIIDSDVAGECGLREGDYLAGLNVELESGMLESTGRQFAVYYKDKDAIRLATFTTEQLLTELLRREKVGK